MEKDKYDIVILGAGPAGYQAAIHAARRKASVLMLGKPGKSSAHNTYIENYCCIDGISGTELLARARGQAEKVGVHVREEDVTGFDEADDRFILSVESGQQIKASAVILAMGVSRNKLGIPNENQWVGRGLSYCVDCDGPLFKGLPVAVAGNESAAGSGALTLLLYASEVHLICDAPAMDAGLFEKIKNSDIILHEKRRVTALNGDESLSAITLDDQNTVNVNGLFVEMGAKGAVELTGKLGVMMDSETMKHIRVNQKQETNIPGLYAAGDICGPPWQVAKAVGEGCVAGIEAAAYAKRRNE